VQEGFEESKRDANSQYTVTSKSLNQKRNLVPNKKPPNEEETSNAAAQNELARLKAELEKEKAEKERLVKEFAA